MLMYMTSLVLNLLWAKAATQKLGKAMKSIGQLRTSYKFPLRLII